MSHDVVVINFYSNLVNYSPFTRIQQTLLSEVFVTMTDRIIKKPGSEVDTLKKVQDTIAFSKMIIKEDM